MIPDGWLVTLPEPDLDTVSFCGGRRLKVAVTARACVIATVQLPVPEQPAPDQPAKTEPMAAAAVN
jgi:hypothetical protein